MGIFQSLGGMAEVELVSADTAASLNGINALGVEILHVQLIGELTVRFFLRRKDWRRADYFARKRGDRLVLLHRRGAYWTLKRMLHRPVLTTGICAMLALALSLPSRILFVRVEGCESLSERQVLEAAENGGVCFGASRREVRSDRIKNALLTALPQLQWAGVNTYGCVAVITVRERTPEAKTQNESYVANIVAVRDGVILSCTATQGNALCVPGEAVQAGDVLISGYTDCGLRISATRAEGEVYAETRRDLTVYTPSVRQKRTDCGKTSIRYAICLGKKRINFSKGSGISDGTCVKMYQEYILTLPGGFELPVSLVVERITSYQTETETQNKSTASEELSAFAGDYLTEQMLAGSITAQTEVFMAEDGRYTLIGSYACTEMIGRERREETGE